MKRMLVDTRSVADLLYLPALVQQGYKLDSLRNPGRILVGFNGTQTQSLGEIVIPISVGLITATVLLTVIDEPLNFNAILGRT